MNSTAAAGAQHARALRRRRAAPSRPSGRAAGACRRRASRSASPRSGAPGGAISPASGLDASSSASVSSTALPAAVSRLSNSTSFKSCPQNATNATHCATKMACGNPSPGSNRRFADEFGRPTASLAVQDPSQIADQVGANPYMSKFGESILRSCANLATTRPWWVILVTLVLTALAGYAIDQAHRRHQHRRHSVGRAAVPADRHRLRADVPAGGPRRRGHRCADRRRGGCRGARAAVAARRTRPQFFERVEVAGSSPYFDRYGLLFLDPAKITEIGDELRQARRLLTALANDPTPARRSPASSSWSEQGVAESAAPPSTAGILTELADTVDKLADGQAGRDAVARGVRRRAAWTRARAGCVADEAGPQQQLDQPRVGRADALDAAIADVDAEISRRQGARHRRAGAPAAGAERRVLRRALCERALVRPRRAQSHHRHPLRPAHRRAADHARRRLDLDDRACGDHHRPPEPDLRRVPGAVLRPRRRFRHASRAPAPRGGEAGKIVQGCARRLDARRGAEHRALARSARRSRSSPSCRRAIPALPSSASSRRSACWSRSSSRSRCSRR